MSTIKALPEKIVQDKRAWLDVGHKILDHYGQELSISGVGACIDKWRVQKDIAEAEILDALGFLAGELIIALHGGEWVLVDDQWGTTPAIRQAPGSTVFYILDSVSKRLREESCEAERELPSIAHLYAEST